MLWRMMAQWLQGCSRAAMDPGQNHRRGPFRDCGRTPSRCIKAKGHGLDCCASREVAGLIVFSVKLVTEWVRN